MEFLKFKKESERSTFDCWVPTSQWNFNVVSLMTKKVTEESPEEYQALVFETGILVSVNQPSLKERKMSNDGKVIREIVENKTHQEPYQVIVSDSESIKSFVIWLDESTIVDATKNAN